jgi:hypothetical protein
MRWFSASGLILCRSITRLGVSPAPFAGTVGAVVVGLPGAAQDCLPADLPGCTGRNLGY